MSRFGGSGAGARNAYCTNKWLADIINLWCPQVDPCSNERSHIEAVEACCILELGDDGLHPGVRGTVRSAGSLRHFGSAYRVFINPPYGRGQVIRWIRHWVHADFCFLLKWDPSTKWFAELWPQCWGAWFPNRRINFEPPPGVPEPSSNPFPHALYLRSRPTGEYLDALLANGYFIVNGKSEGLSAGVGASGGGRGDGADTGGPVEHTGAGAGRNCPARERGCEGRGPCTCEPGIEAQSCRAIQDPIVFGSRDTAGEETPGGEGST